MVIILLVCPSLLDAQTGGPVGKDQMGGAPAGSGVNEFNGEFNYSLPLLTVPGPSGLSYPVTLTYRSGENPDGGVSWVGYGWSLNPGAIVRDQRGLPDDYHGNVTYWNKAPAVWTVSGTYTGNVEIASQDKIGGGIGVSYTGRYNSAYGYDRTFGLSLYAKGVGSLTMTSDDEPDRISGSISPVGLLMHAAGFKPNNFGQRLVSNFFERASRIYLGVKTDYPSFVSEKGSGYPHPSTRIEGESVNYSANLLASIPVIELGLAGGVAGNYTRQWMPETETRMAYGYLYSGYADTNGVMDYSVERAIPYKKGDLLLPVPFSGADNYYATGSTFSGALRLHSVVPGHFFPNNAYSELDIDQAGVELHGGGRWGFGTDVGDGSSVFHTQRWNTNPASRSLSFQQGVRSYLFRISGDPGGSLLFGNDDAAVRADIQDNQPFLPTSIYSGANQGGVLGRNIAIDFNINGQMIEKTDANIFYRSFTKDSRTRSFVDRNPIGGVGDGIGEIAVTDASGNRMVYGLPVYARNESRLTYYVNPFSLGDSIQGNFLAFTRRKLSEGHMVGSQQVLPYAASHLLTEITSADYVDLTNNGPTLDDLGAFVKFNYRRAVGSLNKVATLGSAAWYSWRMPYRGFTYGKGEFSDPEDDCASFVSGEREIYYVSSIETKTHIAFFVTNRTDTMIGSRRICGTNDATNGRKDGYQSTADVNSADAAWDSTYSRASGANLVEKLERIDLFAKDSDGALDSLVTSVYFYYDYSLRPNMPNSQKVHPDSARRVGMLTLRNVWSQERGIVNAKITPYSFTYEYPAVSHYPYAFRQQSPEIANHAASLSAGEQNPYYSPFQFDAWGAYQYDGKNRYENMRLWVNQTPDSTQFDPAAWQLKQIKTPSGGELQVQYEQNDYAFVQDRPAHALVRLVESPAAGYTSAETDDATQFYLNLDDLGIPDSSLSLVSKVRAMILRYTREANTKAYFRLLYALKGTANFADPEYSSEYITGFGNVHDVVLETIATTPYNRYALRIDIHGDGDVRVPKKICREFVKKRRRGKLGPEEMIADEGGGVDRIYQMLGRFGGASFTEGAYCNDIDYEHSYIRIPIPFSKKGGGIRVKRLLSYDPGMEGDTAVYGTEYLYKVYDPDRGDTVSSGVAADEPDVISEENPLFGVWTRNIKPELNSRLVYGQDQDQFSGVVGESLMPGASVGYSRVITRNITKSRIDPGFNISSFYTTRDYPFLRWYPGTGNSVEFSDVQMATPNFSNISLGLIARLQDHLWLSQGYRFVLNDMNGKPRTMQSYGGLFSDPKTWHLSSSTEYTYFEPGEKVPVVSKPGDPISYENPGKEMEVVFESRSMKDEIKDWTIEGDLSMSWFLVDIQAYIFASINTVSASLQTHVTSKAARYPAIQKGVLTYSDGMYHSAENVAFDRTSGAPVIVRTSDDHDRLALPGESAGHEGLYHTFNVPAFRQYGEMGQKAVNEHYSILQKTSFKKGAVGDRIFLYDELESGQSCALFDRLSPGDLVRIYHIASQKTAFYHIAGISKDTIDLYPVSSSFASSMSETGQVDLEVIRSGRTNQISASAGSVTTYGTTKTEVANGTYVSLSQPDQYVKRKAFADYLNDLMDAGGGVIPPAVANSFDVDFLPPLSFTCGPLSDSLLLFQNGTGGFSLMIAEFQIDSTIHGTPSSPHALVGHLNSYLDTLWGWKVDTSVAYHQQCDSATYNHRSYNNPVTAYETRADAFLSTTFTNVNGSGTARPMSDYVTRGPDDGLTHAFKVDAGSYLRASGTLHLTGTNSSDYILTQLWVSECSGLGRIHKVSFNGAHVCSGTSRDTTFLYQDPSKSTILSFFPYTSNIGLFREDDDGYLTYKDLYEGAASQRIYDIKFVTYDTTISNLICLTTLPNVPDGRFDVSENGTLVFKSGSDNGCGAQEVSCLRFCPFDDVYTGVSFENAIAAGAVQFADSSDYNAGGLSAFTGNSYEAGKRGKWRPRASFAYRTDAVPGSRHDQSERNYKNAGVFTDFTLFNWKHPGANDTLAWLRADSVTRYSANGEPVESIDPFYVPSTVKFGHKGSVPIIAATNTTYNSVDYLSFEEQHTATLVTGPAHSGERSLMVTSNLAGGAIPLRMLLTQQMVDSGVNVRLWTKGVHDTSRAFIGLMVGLPTSYVTGPKTRIARTGEWTLYEVHITNFGGAAVGTPVYFSAEYSSSGMDVDTFWVDDVRVQPTDAQGICFAYDRHTLTPLVTFDAQHFGIYSQYDVEGRLVRTIAETERGFRTVQETHVHLPRATRPGTSLFLPFSTSGGGSQRELRARYNDNVARTRIAGMEEAPASALERGERFDLLDVEITPDQRKVRVLGSDKPRLPRLSLPDLDSLGTPALRALDKLKMLERLKELEGRSARLDSIDLGTLDAPGKAELCLQREEIERARKEALDRLGLTEEEWERRKNELLMRLPEGREFHYEK